MFTQRFLIKYFSGFDFTILAFSSSYLSYSELFFPYSFDFLPFVFNEQVEENFDKRRQWMRGKRKQYLQNCNTFSKLI